MKIGCSIKNNIWSKLAYDFYSELLLMVKPTIGSKVISVTFNRLFLNNSDVGTYRKVISENYEDR
jgi:hypothetical protein